MANGARRSFLSPTARRLIRSYGLLILAAIAFLLMVLLVREKPRTVPEQSVRFHQMPTEYTEQAVR